MSIAFVSDLHLTAERPPLTGLFTRFMAGSATGHDALYILGDLFEYWIGDDAAAGLSYQPVEDAIIALGATGVPVYLLHGNRDFLLGDDFCRRTGSQLLTGPARIELFGRPALLMHGDELCTDDHDHQRFRRLVLDPVWQRDFLARPLADRRRLAREARQRSELGKQSKPRAIMDVNQAEAERVMREYDVDLLIHGHTHRPAIHTLELAGQPARRIVLGDWQDCCSVLTARFDGLRLSTGRAGADVLVSYA